MRTVRSFLMLVVLLASLSGTRPLAAGDIEIIGGWEGSSVRGYGFVSPVWTMAGWKYFAIKPRVSISQLYYTMPGTTEQTKVVSPGASGSLGITLRSSKFALTVAPGYEVRQTSRTAPNGTETEVDERGPMLQAELFISPSPLTTLFAIGSYGEANRYTWARAGVKRQLTNRDYSGRTAWSAGAELTAQGNFESRARQAGLLLELAFPRSRSSIQLHGGYGQSEYEGGVQGTEPYFGAGFYRQF